MFAQLATDKLLRSLDRLEYGSLQLVTPDGRMRQFEGKKPGVSAWLRFHDWRVPVNLAAKGDVGFAHDYQEGKWETNNLENLLSLGMMNDHAMGQYVFGSRVFEYVANLSYKLRMNTLQGSRKNIHAHYDLGNDFYKLWLDPTMTYSSALYHHDGESLEQAQNNKYDRMIDRLGNASGNILEVGCGWGGFADRCLQRGDYDLKGITLSSEQKLYADQRLNGKANIALEDYRTQTGKFDNIVSIEMFEAVGEEYWPTYFNKIFSLLRPGGKALIQTIAIEDRRFDRYRRGTDIIRSCIFPGGLLPSPSRFKAEAQRAGLRLNDSFSFGQDYAKTLEQWLLAFDDKELAIKALGFDDRFVRMWRFYLAACIAGFRTGRTDVMQIELQHA